MKLTRTGVTVAVAAVGLLVAARVFGLVELFVMGVSVAALVLGTALWVRLRSIDLAVSRDVRPRRLHAGDPSIVEITLHNRVRTSPVLRVHDPVTGTRGADLMLAPLFPRATTTASYRLPTSRRGLILIGPMTVTISDPFGLWTATNPAVGPAELTVLPAVDDIPPMDRTIGPDPDAGTSSGSIGRRGDDFAALRSYVIGDDLRRVHWPSSARTDDDLLVRQDDVPWHGRVSVVLDLRRHVHSDAILERAVSAAASVARAHIRRGDHVRLVTTASFDSGFAAGGAHLARILDHLAIAELGPQGGLRATIEQASHGGSGALIVVSGRPSAEDLATVDDASSAISSRRVVCFDGDNSEDLRGKGEYRRSPELPAPAAPSSQRAARARVTARGTGIVGIGPDTEFPVAWVHAESGHRRSRRPTAAGYR